MKTKMIMGLALLALVFTSAVSNGAVGDTRRFLVEGRNQDGDPPPNADTLFVTKFNFVLKAGRPGSMPIPNSGGNGDGNVEIEDNLCGAKWDGISDYVDDTNYSSDLGTRTWEGLELLFIQGDSGTRNERVDVFILVDTVAGELLPDNGTKFNKWRIEPTAGPASEVSPENPNICKVGETWYSKFFAVEQ